MPADSVGDEVTREGESDGEGFGVRPADDATDGDDVWVCVLLPPADVPAFADAVRVGVDAARAPESTTSEQE